MMKKREKSIGKWMNFAYLLFALLVVFNEAIGGNYGYVLGFGGIIIAIIGIVLSLSN